VTHSTFQELLLTPLNVNQILGFEILSSEKHFCDYSLFHLPRQFDKLEAKAEDQLDMSYLVSFA